MLKRTRFARSTRLRASCCGATRRAAASTAPPSIYHGLALFGCADGWVITLRVADGQLVWRFRAAPDDGQLVSYGQLESVWPAPGSVLVQDGSVYFVAGRSS